MPLKQKQSEVGQWIALTAKLLRKERVTLTLKIQVEPIALMFLANVAKANGITVERAAKELVTLDRILEILNNDFKIPAGE